MKRTADVVVVGGGVTGCAVAYELAKQSVDVLLLDKSLPGRATSASAGGLWPIGEAVGLGCGVIYHTSNNGSDTSSFTDVGMLPKSFREFLVSSNQHFPELAGRLYELSGIDIEYEPGVGLIFVIYNENERAFVDHLIQSLPPETPLEVLSASEIRRLEPELSHDVLGGALLSGEHQVNPMLLAEALKRSAMKLGASFRHEARVSAFVRKGEEISGVQIEDEFVSCGTVVNAAGAWSGKLAATVNLALPVYPVRGQIVLTEALPHTLNACLSTSGCYLNQKKHGEVLIGSTTEEAGFDVSVTSEAVANLCKQAIRAVPALGNVGIKRLWAGLRPGTPDELPILGPVDELSGYFNATGGFRTGIVASPLTGILVSQCICGEELDASIDPFLTSRFG